MSVTFRQLIADLRELTELLKTRCQEAESQVADLQRQLDEQQAVIEQLRADKEALQTKYANLQTGLAATAGNPEQVALLKQKYLAMVSEIDACIATLQHGQ